SRYLGELVTELQGSLDERWKEQMLLDLAPILISIDRAVSLGLILNELLINATKYAYGGGAGPIEITLKQHRNNLHMVVADRGKGHSGRIEGTGFGSRMLTSLVQSLGGTLDHQDNRPGM